MRTLCALRRLGRAISPVLGRLWASFKGEEASRIEPLERRQMLSNLPPQSLSAEPVFENLATSVDLDASPTPHAAGIKAWYGTGRFTTDFRRFANDQAAGLLQQADGKLIAIGSSAASGNWDFALARYHAAGALDGAFGAAGRVTTDFSSGSLDRAFAGAIQSDGKIVLGGYSRVGSAHGSFALARYNSDGSLDESFGSGGKLSTAFAGVDARIYALAIQSDGKIVAAGYSHSTSQDGNFALARYLPDGSLDSSFSSDGKALASFFGGNDRANALAIQADGKIVVGGSTNTPSGDLNFALARLNADGSLDSSFSSDGKLRTSFGALDDGINALLIQPDGRIVAGGYAQGSEAAIARYLPDGRLDESFNGTGKLSTSRASQINALALDGDGNLLAAGRYTQTVDEQDYSDFAVMRLAPGGSFDATFAGSGVARTDFESYADEARGLVLQADGRIAVAGIATSAYQGKNFALARYNGNGELDSSWDPTVLRGRPVRKLIRPSQPSEDGPMMGATEGDSMLTASLPAYYRVSITGYCVSENSIAVSSQMGYQCYGSSSYADKYVHADSIWQALTQAIGGEVTVCASAYGSCCMSGGESWTYTFPQDASPQDDDEARPFEVSGFCLTSEPCSTPCYTGWIALQENYALSSEVPYSYQAWSIAVEALDAATNYGISPGLTQVAEGPYSLGLFASTDSQRDLISSWTINWGDGTNTTFPQRTGTVVHTYGGGGYHTIVATPHGSVYDTPATAHDYSSPSLTRGVLVTNLPPGTPTITGPTRGQPYATLSYSASATDPGGAADPLTYTWSASKGGSVVFSGTGSTWSFVPSSAGTYTLTVGVTDSQSSNSWATQTVLVPISAEVYGPGAIQLSYLSTIGQQVELEEAGPGDFNYHTIPGATPEASSGFQTLYLDGLTPGHYQFRLKSVQDGQVEYFTAFADTVGTYPDLSMPENLQQGTTNGQGQIPISFQWNPSLYPEGYSGLSVKMRSYSNALFSSSLQPFSSLAFGNAAFEQTFSGAQITFNQQDHRYTVLASLPPGRDQLELQVVDSSGYISPWSPLRLSGVATPPASPSLELVDATRNTNGSITFNLAAAANASIYGITANGAKYLGSTNGTASSTAAAADVIGVTQAIAFAGTSYSNWIVLPGVPVPSPKAPTNLTATAALGPGNQPRVQLTWDNLSDETGYTLQRQDLSDAMSSWSDIAIPADQASYVDTNVSSTHVYNYRVFASNAGGKSPVSNVVLAWLAPLVSGIGANVSPAAVGSPVLLSASAVPPDGTGTLLYSWSVSDSSDNLIELPDDGVTSTPNLSFTPSSTGTWKATLTVTDTVHSLSTTVGPRTITVQNAPALQITGPSFCSEAQTASFTALGATSGLSWTVTKDGSQVASGSGGQFSYTPLNSGTYSIETRNQGGLTATVTLAVAPVSPTVMISGPATGYHGRSMVFAAQIERWPGMDDALSYTWELLGSDGSPYQPEVSGSSTFVTPAGLDAGAYRLRLTVTDTHAGNAVQIQKLFDFSVLPVPLPGADQISGQIARNLDWATVPFQRMLGGGGPDISMGQAIVQQEDGKILVAGYGRTLYASQVYTGNQAFVARFNQDLSLDQSFGPDHTGVVIVDFSGLGAGGYSAIYAMTINPVNQDLVVVGTGDWQDGSGHSGRAMGVAAYATVPRVSTDEAGVDHMVAPGMPDPDFNGGVPLTTFQSLTTWSVGLTVRADSNGRILVGGTCWTKGAGISVPDFLLVRITQSGEMDKTFNDTGYAEFPIATGVNAHCPFTDGDDSLTRISAWPTWDEEWTAGIQDLLVLNNGDILVGGQATRVSLDDNGNPVLDDNGNPVLDIDGNPLSADTGVLLICYTSGGTIKTTFGTNGRSFTSSETLTSVTLTRETVSSAPVNGGRAAYLSSMQKTATGGIMTAIWARSTSETAHLVLASYTVDGDLGSVRNTFAESDSSTWVELTGDLGPAFRSDFLCHPEGPESMFQPDGKLAVSLTNTWDRVMYRLDPSSGRLDSSFGDNGRLDLTDTAFTTKGNWMARPGAMLLTADGFVTVGDVGVTDAARGFHMPMVARYRSLPHPKADDLLASASAAGPVTLSWVNGGFGQEGYRIERSVASGLFVAIATVGANQLDYIDATVSADVSYRYRVIPFYTDSPNSRTDGTPSNEASVHTFPQPSSDYVRLGGPLTVPMDGTTVTTSAALQAGTTYLIVASGHIHVNGNIVNGVDSGFVGDAAYWYSAQDPKAYDRTLASSRYGIGISAAGLSEFVPDWGLANPVYHTYTYAFVPSETGALTFKLHDASYGDNSLQSGDQALQIEIYALNAAPPAQDELVQQIISPAPAAWGAPCVISTNTPVQIISANKKTGGSEASWYLWLVSSDASSWSLLASSDKSVGQLPSTAATVATLNPALYPNGLYTLRLTSSPSDPQNTTVDSRPVQLASVAKTGTLTHNTSDAAFMTSIGQLSISRSYDSGRLDRTGYFGPGWTLGLLDAQIQTTASADTFDPSRQTPVLRPGDLIWFTVPGDGRHVFEFDPVIRSIVEGYAGSPSSIEYLPHFRCVDGSGATLLLPFGSSDTVWSLDRRVLTNDVLDDEYLWSPLDGHEEFGWDPFAFNPARAEFGGVYQLTTKDGTSYTIDAASGRIQAISDANDNCVIVDDTGGMITLSQRYNSNRVFLTIKTSQLAGIRQIDSIQVPGQNPILYRYDGSGNLVSVQSQASELTLYSYQDAANEHLLTAITNGQGANVLQAQYDQLTGRLQTLVNAKGAIVPVTSSALGGEVVQTVTDAAGNIVQDVFDERFGNLTRRIQTVSDETATRYIVTVRAYSYVINEVGRMSAQRGNGVRVLQSIADYAPFEVQGPDAAGVRYSYQPPAGSWTQLITFDTSNNPDDQAQDQVLSVSQRLTENGRLQTTTYSDCIRIAKNEDVSSWQEGTVYFAFESFKPRVVTVKIQEPDQASSTGYRDSVQSTTYADYDAVGNQLYSLVGLTPPDASGYVLAEGTQYSYTSPTSGMPGGLVTDTYQLTTSITVSESGELIKTAGNPVLQGQNAYYASSDYDGYTGAPSTPGALYGAVKWSTNAAGEKTCFGYDSLGHTILEYTYKHFEYDGWVGTTSVYNTQGLLSETYAATYLDGDGDATLDMRWASPGVVAVNQTIDPIYASPILTSRIEYNASGQKISSIDQYGGQTSYTYDAAGHLIRTINPDGTEVRSVYDDLGREIWKSELFKPVNSDPASTANVAVLTHTIYNALGQVSKTEKYQNGVITIRSRNAIAREQMDSQTVQLASVDAAVSSVAAMGTLVSSSAKWYDPAGRVIQTQDESGLRTASVYYPNGQTHYTAPVPTVSSAMRTHDAAHPAYLVLSGPFEIGDHLTVTLADGSGNNSTEITITVTAVNPASIAEALAAELKTHFTGSSFLANLTASADGIMVIVSAATPMSFQVATATTESDGSAPGSSEQRFVDADTTTQKYSEVDALPAGAVSYDSTTDALGHTSRTYKDVKGRTIRTVYEDGSWSETLYSIGGTAVSKDQEGNTIPTPSAAEGWSGIPAGGSEVISLAQRKSTDPIVATYRLYDLAGNLTDVWMPAVIDADPNSPTYGLASGTAYYNVPVRPHWSYGYDTAGNQTIQTDPRGNFTVCAFDQNGNQTRRVLPDWEYEVFTYDQYGRKATHSDFNHNTATYTYYPNDDVHAGMLQQVVYVGAAGSGKATQTVSYTYDELGRKHTVGDASGTSTYGYDALGNLVLEDTPEGVIHYVYDPATGRHTGTWTGVDPDGFDPVQPDRARATAAVTDTSYDYDSQGRLWHVTVSKLNGATLSSPLVTTYGYDAVGNKTSESQSGGDLSTALTSTYTYDDLNRLTDVLEQRGTTTLFSQHYILNSDGTRKSVHEEQLQSDGATITRDVGWTYDALERLIGEVLTTSASDQNYSDAFAYDLASNRRSKIHTGPGGGGNETITYYYSDNDQLTSESSSLNGTTDYGYDANGSQISSSHGGQTTTYGYDVRNKLVSVAVGGVTQATYVYDDAGNRVRETSGATTYYLTDTANPTGYAQPIEQKSSPTATPAMSYVLGDRVLAQANAAGAVSYLLSDGHGSTRALAGSAGAVSATYNYDAFGTALGFTAASAGTVFLFGGDAVFDPASGMYFHGNGVRQRLGFRFIEMDTYAGDNQDPISLHKYLYANANPVNGVDPSGHVTYGQVVGGIGVAVGTAMEFAGLGAQVYGLAKFVIGGYNLVLATRGLMTTDPGDYLNMARFQAMADQAIEQMASGYFWMVGGAFSLWAGGIIKAASLATMATAATTTGAVIRLGTNDTRIGVVLDGKVIGNFAPTISHAEAARLCGVLDSSGNLMQGAEVFTVGNEAGQVWVFGSQNFGGVMNLSQSTKDAVLQYFGPR